MIKFSLADFADSLNETMPVIIREFARRQTNELYRGKITLPQFLILEFLYRQGESKMTTMAQFMQVTTAAMTGIVDRLVKQGYCQRADDLKDRRIIRIKLTAPGEDLVKRINQQRRRMVIKIFSEISQKDRADYLHILMQIKEILTKEKKEL